VRVLLLPGMDGTGRLFGAFQRAVAPGLEPTVVGYGDAIEHDDLMRCVPTSSEPIALVAESFSGPLAVKLAESGRFSNLRAVVLVASFLRPPRTIPWWIAGVIRPVLFKLKPPRAFLRWALLGSDTPDEQVAELQATIASVSPTILAARLRSIVSLDVSEAFARSRVPTLYIRGLRDRLVPPSVLEEMVRLRPDLEHETLDAPHLVLQRCPVESARLVSSFLLRFIE
jgi:pimeloyl-[acyl-carrier protein] methyl ester esterase